MKSDITGWHKASFIAGSGQCGQEFQLTSDNPLPKTGNTFLLQFLTTFSINLITYNVVSMFLLKKINK